MRIFFSVLLFLYSMQSFAYQTGSWTTVKQIYSKNGGSIYVNYGENSLPGCYQNNSAYLKGSDIGGGRGLALKSTSGKYSKCR
jgi:hypothetical protein